MRRFPEKLLAALLSVVLGLIPLQGAMAGFTSSLEQKSEVHQHQMGNHHNGGQVVTTEHGAMMDCENCNADTGCSGGSCSSGHCVSCLLGLLPDFSFSTLQITFTAVMQTHSDLVNQSISSLFRPPRA